MTAIRYGTRIDMQNNQILNQILHKQNGLPTPTAALLGAVRFNTSDGRPYICNGTSWDLKATDSLALQGLSPAQLRDRTLHTGQQPASSISDFSTTVKGVRLNEMAAPNGPTSFGNQRITSVADGVANGDVANVGQLEEVRNIALSASVGRAILAPVLAVATSQISLTAVPAIDAVTIPTDGRFLVAGQTVPTENGIYTKQANGAAIRATDADQAGELVPGTQVFVTQGATNGDSAWAIISDTAITPGTNAQSWQKVPGSSGQSFTWGAGLLNTAGTISVKNGFGITVTDGTVAIDRTGTIRPVVGTAVAVPAGTSPVAINHGLGSANVLRAQLKDVATGDLVECGVTVTGANTVSIDFDVNPVANQWQLIIAVV